MVQKFDALILGGGAAGLMCAIEAGKRGRRVAVLERAERLGKKILISGGGRCNFTNIYCRPENFISGNPHFAKSALARYTPQDFIALVEKHGIPYHEKTLGQLFCDRSARDITDMLEDECRRAAVSIFPGSRVVEVQRTTEFVVRTGTPACRNALPPQQARRLLGAPALGTPTDGEEFRAPVLVIATGGLSVPKAGATAFGYEVARQFGLRIRETRPALVPLVLGSEDRKRYCDLAGVSAETIVSYDGHSFREKMLITHKGLSGPAVLQVSSYWDQRGPIEIDLAPGRDVTAALRELVPRNAAAARSALRQVLPDRLAARWLEFHGPDAWTNEGLAELERRVHAWAVVPAGTEGYAKAEVTVGGIDTEELSSQTMESRKIPGLFFIGEVVDVTGQLGGFNFQWAWASGAAAGRAL